MTRAIDPFCSATTGLFLLTAIATTDALPCQGPVNPCHDYTTVEQIQQELLLSAPLVASSSVVVRQGGLIAHQSSTGSFDNDTVVAIASASKTLSAAVLLSLVDDGLLALDDRVSDYLPEWDVGLKRFITLRQCFTHTSGMVTEDPAISDPTITLRQAAQQLASVPLEAVPGMQFAYGGPSMHVAGAVCEVVTGMSWSALFEQRIAIPLGFNDTDYYAFGFTNNPRIAGGARSNARDYGRFCAMLRNDGAVLGTQVLSAASVNELLTDQTSGVSIASTPHPDQAPYGIGIWIERQGAAGETLLAAGIGAFGFAGWVDRAHDSSGTFSVQYLNQQTFPYVRRVWEAIDDAMLPASVACVGQSSPGCVPAAWINANRAPQAGLTDFAILASNAPPNAIGLLAIGDGVTAGVPFFDIDILLSPGFLIADAVLADTDGRAEVAAPLDLAMTGQTFALQLAWIVPQPCAITGLGASHALLVTVQ